jgi:hypothetical protein
LSMSGAAGRRLVLRCGKSGLWLARGCQEPS